MKKVKLTVDLVMTVLLLLLMGYMITGQQLHEWLGTAMLALFIAHHILNFGWHKSLFKGKYPPARILLTALDILLSADMICLAVSGIIKADSDIEASRNKAADQD